MQDYTYRNLEASHAAVISNRFAGDAGEDCRGVAVGNRWNAGTKEDPTRVGKLGLVTRPGLDWLYAQYLLVRG